MLLIKYTFLLLNQFGCHDTDIHHSFFIENVVTKLPSSHVVACGKEICKKKRKTCLKRMFQSSQPPWDVLTEGEKLTVIFHCINKWSVCDGTAYTHCSLSEDKVAVQMCFFKVFFCSFFRHYSKSSLWALGKFGKARFTVRWFLASRGTGPHINGCGRWRFGSNPTLFPLTPLIGTLWHCAIHSEKRKTLKTLNQYYISVRQKIL